jgi:hypothetical protein
VNGKQREAGGFELQYANPEKRQKEEAEKEQRRSRDTPIRSMCTLGFCVIGFIGNAAPACCQRTPSANPTDVDTRGTAAS